MALKESLGESLDDDQKFILYKHDELFSESFPVFKEIRRMGKLCDVTLKASAYDLSILYSYFVIYFL